MDLLLDNDVVLDLCLSNGGSAKAALDKCQRDSGRIWLYTGSVQLLVDSLARRLNDAPQDALCRAKQILKVFSRDKHWLASLSGEGDVFDADDPSREQLLRAVERFPPGSVKLLSHDRVFVAANRSVAILPAEYLDQPESKRKLDFIDLRPQQDAIRPQLEKNVHRVIHHGQYIMGPEVRELEERLAAYVGVKHCVTASSGTDTLLIAMIALGVGNDDEVITTPFSFVATGEMIALLGAKPVFVDIDALVYNLDPAKLEAAITPKTRVIIPVSLYGQCCDMDAINAVAERHGLPVVEDAAQSFGATYKGRRSCGLSTVGSCSFFPSKPLGCYGDGGALFTNDDSLARVLRELRVHGQDRRYHHPRLGINGRLDTLQAAVLLAKFERFHCEVARRQTVATRYTELLTSRNSNSCCVVPPHIEPYNSSIFAQYTVSVDNRDLVATQLNSCGFPAAVHYPIPLHLQPAFQPFGYHAGDFPVAEAAARRVLSLPMGPDLDVDVQDTIVAALQFNTSVS